MVEAKITNKTRNQIYFEGFGVRELTEEDAAKAQTELGYMPQGYGIYGFKTEYDAVLCRHVAKWWCSASCD